MTRIDPIIFAVLVDAWEEAEPGSLVFWRTKEEAVTEMWKDVQEMLEEHVRSTSHDN